MLYDAPRFVFFAGKGGVGKTSLSCATAVHLGVSAARGDEVSRTRRRGPTIPAQTRNPGSDAAPAGPEASIEIVRQVGHRRAPGVAGRQPEPLGVGVCWSSDGGRR
jgi:hypothetical protein